MQRVMAVIVDDDVGDHETHTVVVHKNILNMFRGPELLIGCQLSHRSLAISIAPSLVLGRQFDA